MIIRSRDNALFKSLRRLATAGRERRKCGQTLLDGAHLLKAWELSRGRAELVAVSEHGLQQAEIVDVLAGREVTVFADALFRELAPVDTPSGILARVAIPVPLAPPDRASDTVVLDGVQDPGNLGTLIRTAAAAGFAQVVLSADCAAPWSPRALRAGQGGHFALAVHEQIDLPRFLEGYLGTVAATCLDDAASLYEIPLGRQVAWVFGAEGSGIRPEVLAQARLRVRIPMPGQVESLNVAAAAAVCLFETVRRRLT